MITSILDSTKKALGIDADYDAFDSDIVMHINSTFTTLNQLGVCPADGFMIEDKTSDWEEYAGDVKALNSVKSYMYLKVRLLFDPPATSFALESMNKMATEFEWRLNLFAEQGAFAAAADKKDSDIVWEISEQEGFPGDAKDGEVGFDPVTGNVWRTY